MHRHQLSHTHRYGSRLFWFAIGAAVSAYWIKYEETRCGHAARSQHCTRASIRLSGVPCLPDTPFSWIHRDIPNAINNIPPAETWEEHLGPWSEEREFFSAICRQATDEVSRLYFSSIIRLHNNRRARLYHGPKVLLIKLCVSFYHRKQYVPDDRFPSPML